MSRPIKKGLSYFPLDTDMLSDRKIRRLFQNYGCEGFSTYMAILCEAYGTTGYYIRYTDDFCFDIGFTLNLQGILTSFGIQSRYREINKRSISRISPEWEIREETAPTSTVEISVPVTETPVLATETAPKGKGNKTNTVTKIQARNEHSTSNDNGEAGRRAELLQMAANATSASRHA